MRAPGFGGTTGPGHGGATQGDPRPGEDSPSPTELWIRSSRCPAPRPTPRRPVRTRGSSSPSPVPERPPGKDSTARPPPRSPSLGAHGQLLPGGPNLSEDEPRPPAWGAPCVYPPVPLPPRLATQRCPLPVKSPRGPHSCCTWSTASWERRLEASRVPHRRYISLVTLGSDRTGSPEPAGQLPRPGDKQGESRFPSAPHISLGRAEPQPLSAARTAAFW